MADQSDPIIKLSLARARIVPRRSEFPLAAAGALANGCIGLHQSWSTPGEFRISHVKEGKHEISALPVRGHKYVLNTHPNNPQREVHLYQVHAGANQLWRFQPLGVDSDFFVIVSILSGNALSIADGDDLSPLGMEPLNVDAISQHFRIVAIE